MADNAEILAGLAEIVEEVAGIDTAEVTADKTFVHDLEIDGTHNIQDVATRVGYESEAALSRAFNSGGAA